MPSEQTPLVRAGIPTDFASKQSNALLGICIVVLAVFFKNVTYDDTEYDPAEYVIFRDIMVMLLLGFGYLMTFLGRYGLGAVGFTMFLTSFAIPLNIMVEHYVRIQSSEDDDGEHPLKIGFDTIIDGEFFAATVLISFGAVIGRASPLQLVVMCLFESIFYAINKVVFIFGTLNTEDVGGSLSIHCFGAYFGLAVSKMLGKEKASSASKADATSISDILSLIGTTLLWVYWPSFVGATETGIPENERLCVTQTILALLGSTLATFFVSPRVCHGKIDPVHVANSTLAGGVAIGASARLDLSPFGALFLGLLAGSVSVYGYAFVGPMLQNTFGIYDTCGVGNLHGLPSVLGGLASAVFVRLDSDNVNLPDDLSGTQTSRQLLGLAVTLCLSIVSGSLTGALMTKVKPNYRGQTPDEYDDGIWWEGDYFQ